MVSEKKRATYQDILDAPDHLIAEIVDGELNLSPRPANRGTRVGSQLFGAIQQRFDDGGGGGPGGWFILYEAEMHLADHVLVPDIAGWRRERMPEISDGPGITIVPDWVCEVLSPSTERFDRVKKARVYAELGVHHLWFVHPRNRTVEILRRQDQNWLTIAVHTDEETVRAEPFDAIELDLSKLWSGLPSRASEPVGEYAY